MKTILIILATLLLLSCEKEGAEKCLHDWSKWSEPRTTNDWSNGTVHHQFRTCSECGEADSRRFR